SFADALDEAAGSGAPVAAAMVNIGFVPPIIPNLDEGRPEDKEQRRGEALLERLDRLRHMLLLGAVSRQELMDIKALVAAGRKDIMDPHLVALMEEIDTRAAVELAKWE